MTDNRNTTEDKGQFSADSYGCGFREREREDGHTHTHTPTWLNQAWCLLLFILPLERQMQADLCEFQATQCNPVLRKKKDW